ncbi:MAG: VWA domain-containing protein [Luteitalea sp.]|nr:VWA domain-containing protein [Luteitalea sp.]
MPTLRAGLFLTAAIGLLSGTSRAQSPPTEPPPLTPPDVTTVQIVSPEPNSYVGGTTALRATVDASLPVDSVTFFVDGRLACTLVAAPFDCDWEAGQQVVAHQIRLVVGLTDGQRIVRTVRTRGLGFADKVNVEVVQVTTTVTDAGGRFAGGLPRSAFRVLEDGTPQTISYFSSAEVPLELIVAVDISGSMTTVMPRLKNAVKKFLGAVPSRDEVTLLGFNDTVFALTRKTTDPSERMRAVDRLAPWGATALYDVIVRGIDMLGQRNGRKALVVFSDGEDQGSHVAIEDVERRLEASDVTLYMIAQGRGITQEYLRAAMQRLTRPTGGRTFTTDSIEALEGAFAELLDELSNQYLLGYQPTNSRRDDTWREIRVEVAGYQNVRARQGYRAAPYK